MAARITLEVPDQIEKALREEAARTSSTVEDLVIRAVERTYPRPTKKKGRFVTGPMIKGPGELGPDFPTDKTPHGLILP